jgi:hypothetical protein
MVDNTVHRSGEKPVRIAIYILGLLALLTYPITRELRVYEEHRYHEECIRASWHVIGTVNGPEVEEAWRDVTVVPPQIQGGRLHFTVDGSDPTCASPELSGPMIVPAGMRLKVIACK